MTEKHWKQRLKESEYLKIEKHPYIVWIGTAILMELLLEILSRSSILGAVVFMLDYPVYFCVNVLLIMAPYSLMFLTKRSRFVYGVVSCILLLMGVADFVLLLFRTTPLTAQDLLQIDSAMRVMEHYISWFVLVIAGIVVAGILVLLVIWWKKAPVYNGIVPIKKNLIKVVISIGIAVFLFSGIIKSTMLPDRFSNIGKAYQDYGLVYCFISSMVNTGIDKPKDYEDTEVKELLDENAVPEKKEDIVEFSDDVAGFPNVIFLQLESLYDITQLTNVTLSMDPIPYLHELEETCSTGFLSVPCVGAGTANTEFEVMTGMNLDFFGPGEYPYQTVLKDMTCESLGYLFKKQGYTSQAIHNNSAHFYNRSEVFKQLGYDIFTSIEYMQDVVYTETGWAKDAVLTPCIMDALNATETKDYIYTISVQGHGGYPEESVLDKPMIRAEVTDDDGVFLEGLSNAYTYYANQIYEMDCFVKELTDELAAFDEPCILVMYGDHLPTLDITEEHMKEGNLFQTKYIIWSNYELEQVNQDVEAYQLGGLVMDRLGFSDGVMFRYHQKYLKEQPEDITTYLDDMAMLGYDMLYGEQNVYDGENPYIPTKLKLGTNPIRISHVKYEEDKKILRVTGSNFNEYSILVINGKMYEPAYWSSTELVLADVSPKGKSKICVAQMDDYSKAILTSTHYYIIEMGTKK